MITEFVVAAGERAKRLDAFLVSHERGISRSMLQRLIVAGRIRVNANLVKPSQKVKPGDRVIFDKPEPGPLIVNDKPVPLEILYEDDDVMVVNKPARVVVHPTSGHWHGTLLNGLLKHFHCQAKTNSLKQTNVHPGLVHRLDKDTSGVMVVAKTDQAHRALSSQFEKHTITRTYEALVYRGPISDHGTVDVAIGRDVMNGKKVSTRTSMPQAAVTEFTVLEQFADVASRVKITPRTGRQHQLRVHMASLGCPILGDQFYGNQQICRIQGVTIPRVMLHAQTLGFRHPGSKQWKEFCLGVPADMQIVLKTLEPLSNLSK